MEDRTLDDVLSGYSQASAVLRGGSSAPPLPAPLPTPSGPMPVRHQLPPPLPPPPPQRMAPPPMPSPFPALMPMLAPPVLSPVGSSMGDMMAMGYANVQQNTPMNTGFSAPARMHTLSSTPPPMPPPLAMARPGFAGVDPMFPVDSMYRVPSYGNFNRAYDAAQYNASAINLLQTQGTMGYQQMAGRAALTAGGGLVGLGIGAAAGGYFGPRGAMIGAQIGEFAGGMIGMSDTASGMVGSLMRPAIDRRLEALQLQGGSQSYVLSGNQLDPLGRGLSSSGSQNLQSQLRAVAANSSGQLNMADVTQITSVAGDLGLLKDAQTSDAIAKTMKDILSVVGTFAKVTGDPDFRNNLQKISDLKKYGFSLNQTTQIIKDLDSFARGSGQTVDQLIDGAGGAGAAMFQGAGLTAGGGLRAGAMAAQQAAQASASKSYTDIQKALYGGDTGVAQSLAASQAAFITGPGQALLPYVTKRGENGIEIDQEAIRKLSLGQVSFEEAIKQGSARVSGDASYMQELLTKQKELSAEFDQSSGPMGTQAMIFNQARKMSASGGMSMDTAMASIVGKDNARVMMSAAQDPEYWRNMLRQQEGELARRQFDMAELNVRGNRRPMSMAERFFDLDETGVYDSITRRFSESDEDAQLAAINQKRGRFDVGMRVSRVGRAAGRRAITGRSAQASNLDGALSSQTAFGAMLRAEGYDDLGVGYDLLAGEDAYLLDTYGDQAGMHKFGMGAMVEGAAYVLGDQTHGERQARVETARTMQNAYSRARTRTGDVSTQRAESMIAALKAQGYNDADASRIANQIAKSVGSKIDKTLVGMDTQVSARQLKASVAEIVGSDQAAQLFSAGDFAETAFALGAEDAKYQKDFDEQLDSLQEGDASTRLDRALSNTAAAQKQYEEVLQEQGLLNKGWFGTGLFAGDLNDMTDSQKKFDKQVREKYSEEDMLAMSLYAMRESGDSDATYERLRGSDFARVKRLTARGEQLMVQDFGNDKDARTAARQMGSAQAKKLGASGGLAELSQMNMQRVEAGDRLAAAQGAAQLSTIAEELGFGPVRSQEEFARKVGGMDVGSAGYKEAVKRLGQPAVDKLRAAVKDAGGKQFTTAQLNQVESVTRGLIEEGADGTTTKTKDYSEAFNKDIKTQRDMIEVTRAVAASFGDSSKKFSDAVDKFASTGGGSGDADGLTTSQKAGYGVAGMLGLSGVGIPLAGAIAAANYFFND